MAPMQPRGGEANVTMPENQEESGELGRHCPSLNSAHCSWRFPPYLRSLHPRNLLETGSPSVLLIFLVHIELLVLVAEQNSVSLLKGAIMASDKQEQGIISL